MMLMMQHFYILYFARNINLPFYVISIFKKRLLVILKSKIVHSTLRNHFASTHGNNRNEKRIKK